LNDGRTHGTKFLHSLDPISPQGHAAHRHPYIYDPKTTGAGGDVRGAGRSAATTWRAAARTSARKASTSSFAVPDADHDCDFEHRRTRPGVRAPVQRLGGEAREGNENVFLPVAMAPAGCPEAMADELKRCVKELGFRTSHLVPYCGTRNRRTTRASIPTTRRPRSSACRSFATRTATASWSTGFDNFYKTHVLGRPTNCSAALVALVLGGVFRKVPEAQGRVLRVQRRMDPLLDAPHGRRLGMGEGFPADLGHAQDGAFRIHPPQLLRDLRGG